jgi:hypothetical protein
MGDSLGLDMPSTTQAFLIPVKLARALETCIPAVGEVAGFAAGSAFARQSSTVLLRLSAALRDVRHVRVTFGPIWGARSWVFRNHCYNQLLFPQKFDTI